MDCIDIFRFQHQWKVLKKLSETESSFAFKIGLRNSSEAVDVHSKIKRKQSCPTICVLQAFNRNYPNFMADKEKRKLLK